MPHDRGGRAALGLGEGVLGSTPRTAPIPGTTIYVDNGDLTVGAAKVCGLDGHAHQATGTVCVWIGVDEGDHHEVHIDVIRGDKVQVLNDAIAAIERVRNRLAQLEGGQS